MSVSDKVCSIVDKDDAGRVDIEVEDKKPEPAAQEEAGDEVIDVKKGMAVTNLRRGQSGQVMQHTTTDVLVKCDDGKTEWTDIEDLKQMAEEKKAEAAEDWQDFVSTLRGATDRGQSLAVSAGRVDTVELREGPTRQGAFLFEGHLLAWEDVNRISVAANVPTEVAAQALVTCGNVEEAILELL